MHAPAQARFVASLDDADCRNVIIERLGEPFGNMKIDLPEKWLVVVGALAVCEQRRGAGRFALHYAVNFAFWERGAHRVFAEVVESNAASRSLFENVGFTAEGVYRDGYRDEGGRFHNLIPYGLLADEARHF